MTWNHFPVAISQRGSADLSPSRDFILQALNSTAKIPAARKQFSIMWSSRGNGNEIDLFLWRIDILQFNWLSVRILHALKSYTLWGLWFRFKKSWMISKHLTASPNPACAEELCGIRSLVYDHKEEYHLKAVNMFNFDIIHRSYMSWLYLWILL